MEELLREFAKTEPLYASEYAGDTCCMYCEYTQGHYEDGKWVSNPEGLARHEPGCLWRRVCELLGVTPNGM